MSQFTTTTRVTLSKNVTIFTYFENLSNHINTMIRLSFSLVYMCVKIMNLHSMLFTIFLFTSVVVSLLVIATMSFPPVAAIGQPLRVDQMGDMKSMVESLCVGRVALSKSYDYCEFSRD
jgi:hypothetical protein